MDNNLFCQYDVAVFFAPIFLVIYRKYKFNQIKENPIFPSAIHSAIIRLRQNENKLVVTENASPFLHQVAGHTKEILMQIRGRVLKPMLKPNLFIREVTYYEDMENSGRHLVSLANAFAPKYVGCVNSRNDNSPITYLMLNDLTTKYTCPCAIDIKMGTQTFEPTATDAKKKREHIKYCYQGEVGFRITGFKLFDTTNKIVYYADKTLGRSLKPEQVSDALLLFFQNGSCLRRRILMAVISKLERLLAWMKSQVKYHFFCSSILIVYDGSVSCNLPVSEPGVNTDNGSSCQKPDIPNVRVHIDNLFTIPGLVSMSKQKVEYEHESPLALPCKAPSSTSHRPLEFEDLVEVRMIDFAHIVPTKSYLDKCATDEGYIHGVANLIAYLQNIIQIYS